MSDELHNVFMHRGNLLGPAAEEPPGFDSYLLDEDTKRREKNNVLALPETVFPVTSLVVGHPAEDPALRDRLPLDAMVHQEQYRRLSDAEIRAVHAAREETAWARYNAVESVRTRLAQAGITKVTDYYTSELKYSKELHRRVSEMLIETLQAQGLWL